MGGSGRCGSAGSRTTAAQGPGSGEYLNLYDLAFDAPEAHVVRRGADLYYGFFADRWPAATKDRAARPRSGGPLRGLRLRTRHVAGRGVRRDPFLSAEFQGSLLLRVRPAGAPPPAP